MPHHRPRTGPRRLLGSKWTTVEPDGRDKHFEVVEARRDGTAMLVCVVSGRSRTVSRAELADRDRWLPGWTAHDESPV